MATARRHRDLHLGWLLALVSVLLIALPPSADAYSYDAAATNVWDGVSVEPLGTGSTLTAASVHRGRSQLNHVTNGTHRRFLPDLSAPQTTGTVFRGDGRAASEIFENGMAARNPAMSIEEHLAGGNGLIATSKSKFVADGFAVQHNGLTYVIDDVGGTAVKYPKAYKHLAGEREVVFTEVTQGQTRGAYASSGEWIPNPNYGGR